MGGCRRYRAERTSRSKEQHPSAQCRTLSHFHKSIIILDIEEKILHNVTQSKKQGYDIAQTNISIKDRRGEKKQAEALFAKLGLTLSATTNVFCRQAVGAQGIPFHIVASAPKDAEGGTLLREALRGTCRCRHSRIAAQAAHDGAVSVYLFLCHELGGIF